MLAFAVALALSASAGSSITTDLPPPPRPLAQQEVELTFAQKPDLTGFYPKAAMERAVQGSADVMCKVGADQRLGACTPVAETPQGEGFGSSAANLFSMMQVSPRALDGSATANREILLHFNFKLNN